VEGVFEVPMLSVEIFPQGNGVVFRRRTLSSVSSLPSQAAEKQPATQEQKGIYISTFVVVRSVALLGRICE
jgi:hypothetical protein